MATKKRNTKKPTPRTLRDDIAFAAAAAILSNPYWAELTNKDNKSTTVAARCYKFADAMLAERVK